MPTTGQDSPSLGEIGRLLERVSSELGEFRSEVNRKFDNLDTTYVRQAVYDADARASAAYVAGLETRIGSIEGNLQWLVRIIVGAITLAVIGGLFAASKAVGGP